MRREEAMTMIRSVLRLATAAALLTSANAFAQTSGVAPPDRKSDDQNAPQHFDSQGKKPNSDQSLSERLDRSDGVIRPPSHVDRGMVQRPPPTADNEMVIKPPGEGQQRPQPK
jgi:hypothetical protein